MEQDVGRSPASQGRAAAATQSSPQAVSSKAGIPNAGALLALAERVEALTEGSRDLNGAIWALVDPAEHDRLCSFKGMRYAGRVYSKAEKRAQIDQLARAYAPFYTSSLDAAMTLVPKGWDLHLRGHFVEPQADHLAMLTDKAWLDEEPNGLLIQGDAATLPLALTAACLRARAASCDERPKG